MSANAVGFTPEIEVSVDGKPVADSFYTVLVEARHRDNEGQEADTLDLTFDDRDNQIELPRKGAEITLKLGYKETGLYDKGRFVVEKASIRGSVSQGQTIAVSAKAADLRKDVKAEGSKAYEGKLFKDIVEEEAAAMGLKAHLDGEVGDISFDYRLKIDQSGIDFLTALADEVGAVLKPAGGKLVVQKRGSAKSAGGQPLEAIEIFRSDCSEWEIEPDGRMQYGRIEAQWTDPDTGKRRTHKKDTGLKGPPFVLREAYQDEKSAKKAAEAEAGRLNRQTGSGSFTIWGRPGAQAGAPVMLSGFRSGAEGEWRASVVENVFKPGPGGGYVTTVEIKAKEDGKKGKKDDD
jgi:uncharacterized protein